MSEMTHCANCGAKVPVDKPHEVGGCMETLTLTTFLLARIAEDENEARTAVDGHPARMEAECEVKRRIVEAADSDSPVDTWMSTLTLEWVMAVIALPYVDHPDYNEKWKP